MDAINTFQGCERLLLPLINRRTFIKSAAASAVIAGWGDRIWAEEVKQGIPYRTLGKTGEKVSAIGLGGFHIGKDPTEKESQIIIRTAIDSGINFMDNCWDYNEGESEKRMGQALRDGYRGRVFLMTKCDSHNKKNAQRQIDESLARLQTDHLDLLQFHEVIRPTDPDNIFAPGGAVEAALESKKAGKVRYIGFTGHKDPAIHLKMLEVAAAHHFDFDTVQMPLNVMDAHFNSFEKKVLPVLVAKNIGRLGMKPLGSGFIVKSKTVEPIECLHYAMNLPTSVVITGCDSMKILQQALTAARTFRPLTSEQVALLLAKSAPKAGEGEYEKYKVSKTFDGTAEHPEWLA